jgi:signal transduction histidine kinase
MADNTAQSASPAVRLAGAGLALAAAVTGLWALSRSNYLLFHSLAEMFAIVVAFGVFLIAWHSRRRMQNHYLLMLGIAHLFVAVLDVLHLFAYKGMGVFRIDEPDLATQLWIAMRYMTAAAFLAGAAFTSRRLNPNLTLAAWAAATAALLAAIFTGNFPHCFEEGIGLTPFKIAGEYVIAGMFVAALVLLLRQRHRFAPRVWRWAAASLAMGVASELTFTLYRADVYGAFNFAGHILLVLSHYALYRAIVETGLTAPFALLWHDLKQSEEGLRRARDELEDRVRERTADLERSEAQLRRVNRALRTISEVNQALIRATSEEDLLRDICRIVTDFGGYRLAWVGFARRDAGCTLEPVAASGIDMEALRALDLSWAEGRDGGSPAARAACHGEVHVVQDVAAHDESAPWRAAALQFGALSTVALPLVRDGEPFGSIAIAADRPHAFDEEEMRLLGEMADDLAFGIVTLRLRAERETMREQLEGERLRTYAVLNMLPGYVSLVDADYRVRFTNRRFVELFGEPRDRRCHEVIHGQDTACDFCHVPAVLRTGRPSGWEWTATDGRAYHVYAYPFSDVDGSQLVLEMGVDITERKNLEAEVLEVGEQERRRIGQDLHDALGQTLMGVAFMSQALAKRLEAADAELAAQARQLADLARTGQREARQLAHGLVPVEMTADGLMEALRELAQGARERFSIEATFDCPQPVLVPDATASMHLYRIAQEAVTNAVKHGEASRLRLSLHGDGGGVILTVDDDGRGRPQDLDTGRGSGLRIMGHRARMLGGSLVIRSSPDGGIRLVCAVPSHTRRTADA